jgi:uncharacterized protein (TIGR03086 family)
VNSEHADLTLLTGALDQAAGLLGRVGDDQLAAPTPCADWSIGDLVDHLVNTPSVFTTIMRGEEPDWGAPPPRVGADREARFRAAGDDLVAAWRATADGGGSARIGAENSPLDWQLAELAVHTWDLATAMEQPTAALDPAVAERGLAFMQVGLTADNRAPVFAPEVPAPPDADAYTRIAAFAGRQL